MATSSVAAAPDHRGIGRALARANDPPGLRRANPEDWGRRPFGGDIERGRRWNEGRVALEIVRRHDDLTQMFTVTACEPMAPIIKRMSKLAVSRNGLKRRAIGLEAKVAPAHRNRPEPLAAMRCEWSPPLLLVTP